MEEGFTPRIVGFLCNWCSYAGADLVGVTKLEVPLALSVTGVMCSGRAKPVLVAADESIELPKLSQAEAFYVSTALSRA